MLQRLFGKSSIVIEANGAPTFRVNGSERFVGSALRLWMDAFVTEDEGPQPEGAGAAEVERADDHSEPELVTGFQRRLD